MSGDLALMSSGTLLGLEQSPSSEDIVLTAKPHPFGGAVLSPKHARELTPTLCMGIVSSLSEQSYHKQAIPYTLWITEAWRGLGWAEPSAALFWEMATMYHTLYLAGRAYEADYQDPQHIPPILSCGSTSSMGSGNTLTVSENKKKFSTAASAKELPVWLVGTFLLLHCEETAISRNLSGHDERRFYRDSSGVDSASYSTGQVDFKSLLQHPALSPRTRMHASWYNDNAHCASYLLRHLRKVLLLAAVSHNPDAVRACMHLSAIQHHREKTSHFSTGDDIRRQHEQEHGDVGLNVQLTLEDLERLHFWLQPPSGGGVDDPPIKMGEFIWNHIYSSPAPEDATIPLGEVEREVRRHLELELLISHDHDDKDDMSSDDGTGMAAAALSNMSLSEDSADKTQRARQPQQGYQKELSYTQLRGTTILLKPNSHYSETGPSSGASTASGDPNGGPFSAVAGRLHDLAITDCSDVHMYLLQPFEHVTIAGCTGCTIVVGAVAGLLHIVDCEKTTITSAARRILVSNSCDVLHCVFTPSPPLLVGDNRNCQFAPYNTYYEGLREDLLAAGMAAAVVPENQSPYHGNRNVDDAAWPPLQCASNKWKQPVELSKLEIPQVAPPGGASTGVSTSAATGASTSPGADDKAAPDATMHTPVLLPASEFNVLFVPLESESMRLRRVEAEERQLSSTSENADPQESLYCRLLAEVLQLSPFHLPLEYERHVLVKADRIRNIKQTAQKNLTEEQQLRFEEELNRGFRDWLVTSGNLRQVLDLVHMDQRAQHQL